MSIDKSEYMKLKKYLPFVVVYNDLIESDKLSDAELRVLLYLLSQREDMKRSASYIGNALKKHRTTISRILLELEEKGVLLINRNHKSTSDYVVNILSVLSTPNEEGAENLHPNMSVLSSTAAAKTVQNTRLNKINKIIYPSSGDEPAAPDKAAEENQTPVGVLEYWQSKSELPKVRTMSPERKKKLSDRLKFAEFKASWKEAIDLIASTPFLLGDNKQGWKADFDWFIANNNNFLKVLEGKYGKAKEKIEYFKI